MAGPRDFSQKYIQKEDKLLYENFKDRNTVLNFTDTNKLIRE